MATVKEMKATARPKAGKGAARAERRAGRVPGVIYGDSKDRRSTISLDHAELQAAHLCRPLPHHDLRARRRRHQASRDPARLPARSGEGHCRSMWISCGSARARTIRVRIPIHVINADQAPGVKRGGTVNIVTHTIEVLCPADDIPEAIDVDISGLEINYSKHLSDITLPPNVRVLAHGDLTLVTIVPPSGYAEEMKAAAEARRRCCSCCCGCRAGAAGRRRVHRCCAGCAPAAPAAARRRGGARRSKARARAAARAAAIEPRHCARRRHSIHAALRRARQSRRHATPATATISDSWWSRRSPSATASRRGGGASRAWRPRARSARERVLLLLPGTFMNESGRAVAEAAHFYKLGARRHRGVPRRDRPAARARCG